MGQPILKRFYPAGVIRGSMGDRAISKIEKGDLKILMMNLRRAGSWPIVGDPRAGFSRSDGAARRCVHLLASLFIRAREALAATDDLSRHSRNQTG